MPLQGRGGPYCELAVGEVGESIIPGDNSRIPSHESEGMFISLTCSALYT